MDPGEKEPEMVIEINSKSQVKQDVLETALQRDTYLSSNRSLTQLQSFTNNKDKSRSVSVGPDKEKETRGLT